MSQLAERRRLTEERFTRLSEILESSRYLVADKACVYATGSFGRGELGQHSDLDVFIVSATEDTHSEGRGPSKSRKLARLDEIRLQAALIEASNKCGFPPFSGDGKYLVSYSDAELINKIGSREDDAENTLTARLLLLLESRPILGSNVHEEVIRDVINAYWKDHVDHKRNFVPAFFTNDVLRLWRTFCLNYEADLRPLSTADKPQGRLKLYKLQHSRMMTCFSSIIYLLSVLGRAGSVSPEHAIQMAKLTPTERLEQILNQDVQERAKSQVRQLLKKYDEFLEVTAESEEEQKRRFGIPSEANKLRETSTDFGDCVLAVLQSLGDASIGGKRLFRMLVV